MFQTFVVNIRSWKLTIILSSKYLIMSNLLSLSSVAKKIWMSLMGLFLFTFLLVHLSLNLTMITSPDTDLFNEAAHFMGTNPFIQVFQWVLFAGFIVHIILGLTLQVQNWMARPNAYKVKASSEQSFFSKYMIHTAVVIFVFLIIHFLNFFLIAKGVIGEIGEVNVNGVMMEDMAGLVFDLFSIPAYVAFYVIALFFLGFHLDHGIQSAFQSLGLNHPKYTPCIKNAGRMLAIVITLGYILIPLVIYFTK
jgi:succinate dehydrogenase / fumarate reductase cytochrome b subunit